MIYGTSKIYNEPKVVYQNEYVLLQKNNILPSVHLKYNLLVNNTISTIEILSDYYIVENLEFPDLTSNFDLYKLELLENNYNFKTIKQYLSEIPVIFQTINNQEVSIISDYCVIGECNDSYDVWYSLLIDTNTSTIEILSDYYLITIQLRIQNFQI